MATTPEGRLVRYLVKGLRTRADVQRHEDRFSSGVPDLSYALDGVDGWIEAKVLPEWPKRATTPVRPRFRKAQPPWLRKRARYGAGLVFTITRVGRDYLLHGPEALAELVAGVPRDRFVELARHGWTGSIDFGDLAYLLTLGHP